MTTTGDLPSLPKNLLPLIDGDWIVFMACQAIEYSMDNHIIEVLENRVREICNILNTTEEPIYFFSGADNFRMDIATTKKYKGNRSHDKPFNYKNLIKWIEARHVVVRYNNLEADDGMAMYQTEWPDTIIVTVDKDLRQVNGWHYSPELWNSPSFGPVYVTDDNSYIELGNSRMKVVGTGYKFFYSQLLTGDTVDNISGCPNTGPVAAINILADATTEYECYEAVRETYRATCWCADEYLTEQANLLWMVRELYKDGSPVLWEPPIEEEPYSIGWWEEVGDAEDMASFNES